MQMSEFLIRQYLICMFKYNITENMQYKKISLGNNCFILFTWSVLPSILTDKIYFRGSTLKFDTFSAFFVFLPLSPMHPFFKEGGSDIIWGAERAILL